jgi:hypothetical protein
MDGGLVRRPDGPGLFAMTYFNRSLRWVRLRRTWVGMTIVTDASTTLGMTGGGLRMTARGELGVVGAK